MSTVPPPDNPLAPVANRSGLQKALEAKRRGNPNRGKQFLLAGTILFLLAGLGGLFASFAGELFPGSYFLLPLAGLLTTILGAVMLAGMFVSQGRWSLAVPSALTLIALATVVFMGWLRFPSFRNRSGASDLLPAELFIPNRIVEPQVEFGLGIALTFAAALLGLLVSCIPLYRPRDVPENLERMEIEARRANQQKSKSRGGGH